LGTHETKETRAHAAFQACLAAMEAKHVKERGRREGRKTRTMNKAETKRRANLEVAMHAYTCA
jgi:hypothetical protein